MNWYHDIIANDSNIFLNSTIMCVCYGNEEKKMNSFSSKEKLYITNLI